PRLEQCDEREAAGLEAGLQQPLLVPPDDEPLRIRTRHARLGGPPHPPAGRPPPSPRRGGSGRTGSASGTTCTSPSNGKNGPPSKGSADMRLPYGSLRWYSDGRSVMPQFL